MGEGWSNKYFMHYIGSHFLGIGGGICMGISFMEGIPHPENAIIAVISAVVGSVWSALIVSLPKKTPY